MLVHWNSHFDLANMENEVYSERSMSMHSLCSILFFRCLIQSVFFSFAAAISFNKHSYKQVEMVNLVDQVHHFDLFSVNFMIVGEILPIG